jgi:hypothetical protein
MQVYVERGFFIFILFSRNMEAESTKLYLLSTLFYTINKSTLLK